MPLNKDTSISSTGLTSSGVAVNAELTERQEEVDRSFRERLLKDLKRASTGYSIQRAVVDRAVEIREALAADDYAHAEMLAGEVTQIQDAKRMSGPNPSYWLSEPVGDWEYELAAWGEILIHGYKVTRRQPIQKAGTVYAPITNAIATDETMNDEWRGFIRHAAE